MTERTLRGRVAVAGIGETIYLKYHFWVRPKLAKLPSEYFRLHGYASFQEDKPGLDLAENYGLADNLM